ncbi:hypothetical protein ATK36_3889 [Amycolatopsis sulphurea]|uniref:Uncharacterized protein n=1 Tax=Amycolatopsis sulphurea TaxID=76022 RepID=A0A2A9FE56_9PSEU|nr:hypothetical protein ATK36_3889 [Amycolatopsis sulphurea]
MTKAIAPITQRSPLGLVMDALPLSLTTRLCR